MANVLKIADRAAIISLWQRVWSQRRIARETGIHRETVGRYGRLSAAAFSQRRDLEHRITSAVS
jgi:hypothetical protein